MSDVKAVRWLLANNAPLNAVVPAERIQGGVLPQGTALPAIVVSRISSVRRHNVSGLTDTFCTSRVQVTVFAKDYPDQKRVQALIPAALPRSRGVINGVKVDAILSDIEGPDFRDDEAGIFMGSHDFIVKFNE